MDYEYYGPDVRLMGSEKADAEGLDTVRNPQVVQKRAAKPKCWIFEMVPPNNRRRNTSVSSVDVAAWQKLRMIEFGKVLADSVDYLLSWKHLRVLLRHCTVGRIRESDNH